MLIAALRQSFRTCLDMLAEDVRLEETMPVLAAELYSMFEEVFQKALLKNSPHLGLGKEH